MLTFPSDERHFLLETPENTLEVVTHPPRDTATPRGTVILCHPHPLHGGTMNNKVITTLARTFQGLGFRTVRFNFRGVGQSTGTYNEGIGETNDAFAIMNWVERICPHEPIWLAGFSFGAYVAARAASQRTVAQLISVAPPIGRVHMLPISPIHCPWLIIQGDADEVVDPNAVFAWIETLSPPPKVLRLIGATHFFHGRLVELRERLEDIFRAPS